MLLLFCFVVYSLYIHIPPFGSMQRKEQPWKSWTEKSTLFRIGLYYVSFILFFWGYCCCCCYLRHLEIYKFKKSIFHFINYVCVLKWKVLFFSLLTVACCYCCCYCCCWIFHAFRGGKPEKIWKIKIKQQKLFLLLLFHFCFSFFFFCSGRKS